MGWDAAVGADLAFLVYSHPGEPGEPVAGGLGYLWRDGERARFVEGTRHAERDGVWSRRVEITATDALGRRVHARGEPLNEMGALAIPKMYTIAGLTRWHVEFEDGRTLEVFGERQDAWETDCYRRFARALPRRT
jgi:hypothetical protein